MAAADILALIAVVAGLAVAAEMLGHRFDVPTFLFFILAGLVVGPPGLGLVHHGVFGENLGILIGLGVAVIIFHSGSGITVEALREAPREVYLLGTVGVLVTFLGASAATYLLMDVLPSTAVLIGALLVATGTTVIEPLLASVPVREDLAYTLEIEATVTEVAAGLLAVSVFYGITLGVPEPGKFAVMFVLHLLIGILVGAAVAAAAWLVFTVPEHAPKGAPKHASQLYLATAIVAFALAETFAKEAGVAAVATAGILLGNADLPYQDQISEFEETFTTFVIAFLFVVLASFAEPKWLATVGLGGVLVAVAVIAVVRPLAVFLSTATSVLSTREKLYLSAASPRGIIPAGVATMLAITIQESHPTMAANITGTVLIVIVVSNLVEGLPAQRLAERLGVTVDSNLIVGGGRLGMALAHQYTERDEKVTLVERDWDVLAEAREEGYPVYYGDGTDERKLRDAGAERATRIVAATDDDETNLEVIRLANDLFDVETVLTRINDGGNRERFDAFDVEMFRGSQLELYALDNLADKYTPGLLTALTRSGGVETIEVADGGHETVAEFDDSLPDRAIVMSLTRDGETRVPEGDDRIEPGDTLTVFGQAVAVEETVERLTGRSD
jgi:NhaP-type Na+/H+ or K+/H+ antiporter/Trk K+ transport system NAD-binding subunit